MRVARIGIYGGGLSHHQSGRSILGNRVAGQEDVGRCLVHIGQVNRESLRARCSPGIGHSHRNRMATGITTVEESPISDRNVSSTRVDGEPPTRIIDQRERMRIDPIFIGHYGGSNERTARGTFRDRASGEVQFVRNVVTVGHAHVDGLEVDPTTPIAGLNDYLVNIVATCVGRPLEVRGRNESQSAGSAIDRKFGGISASRDTIGDGVSPIRIRCPDRRNRGAVFSDRHRSDIAPAVTGDLRRFVDICHPHANSLRVRSAATI